ncbi:MAG: cytochrome d ubiquinol oxidase subunit II [Acidimicrobiia bacterium]
MVDAVALVLWLGVTLYAVFGGADFGAGSWDLVAGGAERGRRPRALIDVAIGPVWEANHVWLIFCLVVLWTGFPTAFASIMTTLYIPLTIAAFGIVARGAGFAFVRVSTRLSLKRVYGATFAISSLIAPFFLGAVAGAIASGRVPTNGQGDPWDSWVNPTSALGGVLAVLTCAYLAAVFLVSDARRHGAPELEAYFRVRAIGAAVVVGIVAFAGIWILQDDAPRLHDRLLDQALPLVVISVLLGLAALVLLIRDVPRLARACGAGAVAAVIGGWGVAQYPYLLGTHLTLDQGAAPDSALAWILGVFVLALVTVVPGLFLLYALDQRGDLEAVET